jgi:cyclin H
VAKPGLLQQLQAKASSAADVLMATDAPLLLPPSQLALAALRSACRHLGLGLGSYIRHAAQQQHQQQQQQQQQGAESAQRVQQLLAALDALDAHGKRGSQKPPEEQLRGINKRMRRCWQLAAAAAAGRAAASDVEREQRREAKVKGRAEARDAAEERLLGGA